MAKERSQQNRVYRRVGLLLPVLTVVCTAATPPVEPTFWQQYRWDAITVLLFVSAQTALIIALAINRAKRREAETVATLTADLSSRFINVPPDKLGREIEAAQRRICECLGLDVSALWEWGDGASRPLRLTHLWRPPGTPPGSEHFDARDSFPWCVSQLLRGNIVCVQSMDSLPAEAAADRENWRRYGIKSTLMFPLSAGGSEIVGALTFDTLRAGRVWSGEITSRLQLIAQIFANALARRAADEALRESQARLSLAADSSGMGFWSLNLSSREYWLTPKSREFFQLRPDQSLNFDQFLALILPEDQPAVHRVFSEATGSKKEGGVEYRIVRPDGAVKWLSARGRVRSSFNGQPDHLMGVVVDITERKKAEEALREAQATLNAIIDSTDDMIWSVDPVSFGLITFNRGLREYFLTGRGIQLKPGMRPEDLTPSPEHVRRWRDYYQRALRDGPFTTEYVTTVHNRTVQLSFSVLKRDGKVFGVSTFAKDVSDQKKAEREALGLRNTLAHSGRVTLLGQLASALAHELSQPLGAILRNAEAAELMLQDASPDLDEIRTIVADIRKDDQRAGQVIERLRSLLKRRALDLQPVRLDDVIVEVLALVHTDASARQVKLSYATTPGLPGIRGDRIHLQQVLLNLLLNAMDALAATDADDRRIHVSTRLTDSGAVEVRVCDNGHGFPDESAERLFEPFFTTKSHGMGMGLPVSRTIIEAHKGRIWAENRTTGGACFCFTVPVTAGERQPANELRPVAAGRETIGNEH